ncbi:hypothetical protein ElyMa_001578100 [Elysia marginata]|uniref:C2H2-type domain-containing protein n=1 Tax=Elysia marginata TaxID=1093978 RepID=A0AAV4JEE5_9GAST|nr:hypothetical protein ElyMa_001578100 [Elysia marginata]
MKIFKNTLKASMKDFNFDLTLWEALAQNRSAWCGPVIKGVKTLNSSVYSKAASTAKTKQAAQKALANCNPTPQATAAPLTCPHYNRDFRARIGLISHIRAH